MRTDAEIKSEGMNVLTYDARKALEVYASLPAYLNAMTELRDSLLNVD